MWCLELLNSERQEAEWWLKEPGEGYRELVWVWSFSFARQKRSRDWLNVLNIIELYT